MLTLPVSYYLSERDYPAGIPGIALEKSVWARSATQVSRVRRHCGRFDGQQSALGAGLRGVPRFLRFREFRRCISSRLSTARRCRWIWREWACLRRSSAPRRAICFYSNRIRRRFAVDQHGNPRRGFPVRFNEIRMGVVCADVANDAYLEIVRIAAMQAKRRLSAICREFSRCWTRRERKSGRGRSRGPCPKYAKIGPIFAIVCDDCGRERRRESGRDCSHRQRRYLDFERPNGKVASQLSNSDGLPVPLDADSNRHKFERRRPPYGFHVEGGRSGHRQSANVVFAAFV